MSFLSWTVQSSQIRAGAQCSGPKYPQNEPQKEFSSLPFSLLLSLSLRSCVLVTILQTRITVTMIKSIAWAHNLPVSSSAEACCLPNGSGASGTEFGLQGGAMREEVTPRLRLRLSSQRDAGAALFCQPSPGGFLEQKARRFPVGKALKL